MIISGKSNPSSRKVHNTRQTIQRKRSQNHSFWLNSFKIFKKKQARGLTGLRENANIFISNRLLTLFKSSFYWRAGINEKKNSAVSAEARISN